MKCGISVMFCDKWCQIRSGTFAHKMAEFRIWYEIIISSENYFCQRHRLRRRFCAHSEASVYLTSGRKLPTHVARYFYDPNRLQADIKHFFSTFFCIFIAAQSRHHVSIVYFFSPSSIHAALCLCVRIRINCQLCNHICSITSVLVLAQICSRISNIFIHWSVVCSI